MAGTGKLSVEESLELCRRQLCDAQSEFDQSSQLILQGLMEIGKALKNSSSNSDSIAVLNKMLSDLQCHDRFSQRVGNVRGMLEKTLKESAPDIENCCRHELKSDSFEYSMERERDIDRTYRQGLHSSVMADEADG